MKAFLTTIFTLITFHLSAQTQNYSIINFVNNFSRNINFLIYLNDQQIGSLNNNENLEYKMYSEGRVSIIILVGPERITGSIDVKKGNTYYYQLAWGSFKQVDEEKGKRIYERNANTVKVEESKKNPIIRSTKNDNDEETGSTGPKQGTCFLVNQQGYLITNYHVISGAKTVQIKGIGNDFSTLYGADVMAYDVDLDLALLRLKNQNLTFPKIPYSFSTETNTQGTKSFVLGYPLANTMGEEIKVTEGIISSKSGYKGSISQYQFSAAIQPGNSGSPLFNDKGEVIGVINAKLQGAEGAGYAIKSQYASTFIKLVGDLQTKGDNAQISDMNLADKIATLKNFIFIVKTE